MTAVISSYKNLFYSRDYEHDLEAPAHPGWQREAARITKVALPFLSLHRSLRFPISLAMGTLRVHAMATTLSLGSTSEKLVHTAIATCALAATVFAHPAGMIVTTAQDCLLEARIIKQCFARNTAASRDQALKHSLKLASHLLYLTLLCKGGLELSIASLATQAAVLLLSSYEEFERNHTLEGVGSLLMAAVRLYQGYGQVKALQRRWEIDEAVKHVTVGSLHEKWRFPSDHLPVGITVNGVRIISWNVMNNIYMEWVTTKDSQGINGSLITELDKPITPEGLTLRDALIAREVAQMTCESEIIALQECGEPFLAALTQRLPSGWQIVRSFEAHREDQDVILYNAEKFSYAPHLSETSLTAYPSVPGRAVQQAHFEGEKLSLAVVNAHIPGNPKLPGRFEFAKYVQGARREGEVLIALGDCNFERHEMLEAFLKEGFDDFSLHSPWQTNIDPYGKYSKGIDHFFVLGAEESRDLKPAEVLAGGNLEETIALLREARAVSNG